MFSWSRLHTWNGEGAKEGEKEAWEIRKWRGAEITITFHDEEAANFDVRVLSSRSGRDERKTKTMIEMQAIYREVKNRGEGHV